MKVFLLSKLIRDGMIIKAYYHIYYWLLNRNLSTGYIYIYIHTLMCMHIIIKFNIIIIILDIDSTLYNMFYNHCIIAH